MFDEKTALGQPLPHPQNKLSDDVLRLREAITGISDGMHPAHGASALAVTYSAGRVATVTESVGGQPCVQTMAYNGDGTVKTITTVYLGRTRVETFTYAAGLIAGSTATEVQA